MTTDNRMTNQFTDEQVEAAAKAYWLASEREIHDKPITWEWDKEERRRYMWAARQVLAGVAPQAPEGRELDALRALIENRARVIEGFSGAPAEVAAEQKAIARSIRRDLEDYDFEFRVAPVQPSSTVDEGKLAEVREADLPCPHEPKGEFRRRGKCHRCTVESGWLAVDGTTSDGYHTFDELYRYRMLYNAHAARGWHSRGITVVKSYRHSDGEECFGGGWFIVTALLPSGQVSNHYEAEHWDLFDIPSVGMAPEYDGHTPEMAAARLKLDLRPDRNGRPGHTCTPFCNAESGAHVRICPNFKESTR